MQDRPLPILEQQTISAPHMHAAMLELLAPHLDEGSRALDVGSGATQFQLWQMTLRGTTL
jgi:protein-L-isoaspartate(D-aspartate) O-methyltransferase